MLFSVIKNNITKISDLELMICEKTNGDFYSGIKIDIFTRNIIFYFTTKNYYIQFNGKDYELYQNNFLKKLIQKTDDYSSFFLKIKSIL